MPTHKTVQKQNPLSPGQMKDLSTTVVGSIPNDYPYDYAQYWAGKKGKLQKRIREVLLEPFSQDVEPIIQEWERFYLKWFGMETDFSSLIIPEIHEDIIRPILIAPGVSENLCVKQMRAREIKVSLYRDDLTMKHNDRTAENGPYAIRVRDVREADETLKNLSAIQLKEKNISGETLLERLIHGMKFFDETGLWLDEKNWTLCCGSRNPDGAVPGVRLGGGGVRVDYCSTDNAYDGLRAREVVS